MPLDERRLLTYERELLDRARDWPGYADLAELTVEEMRAVAEREGIGFATALLYRRICTSEEHGRFIRAINDVLDERGPIGDTPFKLAIVPGAFYREFPASGADGRLVREAARRLEIDVEVIPIQSFGSIDSNAEIIANWLQGQDRGPTVLVSLSKGGSDIKQAITRDDAPLAFRDVVAWVNLSGILYGTPLVSWILAGKLRSWWYRCLLGIRGYDFGVVHELDCVAGSPLCKKLSLPAGMRAIHVVGFPLKQHLTNALARRCYRRIRHCGPNDAAGILLGDLTQTPGFVYPIWGADHYLRPHGQDPIQIAQAILRYLAQNIETAASISTTDALTPSLERCR